VAARQISPIKEPLASSAAQDLPQKVSPRGKHCAASPFPQRHLRVCCVRLRRKSFQSPRNNHSYVPVGFIGITGERFRGKMEQASKRPGHFPIKTFTCISFNNVEHRF